MPFSCVVNVSCPHRYSADYEHKRSSHSHNSNGSSARINIPEGGLTSSMPSAAAVNRHPFEINPVRVQGTEQTGYGGSITKINFRFPFIDGTLTLFI